MSSGNEKKYLILKKEITDYIRKNNLKQGSRLPTVKEIIENYSVSYATVNRTLIELENEGVILKHQGKGLYVNNSLPERGKCAGLIIPSPVSEYKIFVNILNGIKEVLEKAGISLLISISNMSHHMESENILQMIDRQTDGLIIFPEDYYRKNYEHIKELKRKNYPFVLIDRYIPELDTDYVVVNNSDALYRICSYLKYRKNCEKIFFVPDNRSTKEITATEEKIKGYAEAVKILFGPGEETVIELSSIIENLEKFGREYRSFGISFVHDGLVLEFLKNLKEKDINLPENCHLFGYNNSHEPLRFPTVEQFNDEVGKKAAELLIERINNPGIETRKIKIAPRLIIPDEKEILAIERL